MITIRPLQQAESFMPPQPFWVDFGNYGFNVLELESNVHLIAAKIQAHAHDYYQIIYYKEGHEICKVAKDAFTTAPGLVYFVPPHTEHLFSYLRGSDASTFVLNFELLIPAATDELKILAREDTDFQLFSRAFAIGDQEPAMYLNGPEFEHIDGLVDNIEMAIASDGFANLQCLRAYILLFAANLIRYKWDRISSGNTAYKNSKTNQHITIAISFIKSTFEDPALRPQTVADNCLITLNYLEKLFKDKLGATITDFIQSQRIKSACSMLRTKQHTISEIGYRCGFLNHSYFSEIFIKHKRMTPSAYRKKHLR